MFEKIKSFFLKNSQNVLTAVLVGLLIAGMAGAWIYNPDGSVAQTPWAQNIDGAGYNLSNAGTIWTTGLITASGTNPTYISGDGTGMKFGSDITFDGGSSIYLGDITGLIGTGPGIQSSATDTIDFVGSSGFAATWNFASLLADRIFTLPDAEGTVMLGSQNLSELTATSTARTNLGLGTIATQNSNNVSISGGSISGITDLALADGGTGASTAANARLNLGVATTTKGMLVESPTASENLTMFYSPQAITITRVSCLNNPAAGNTVTFQMPHGTDRSAAGTNLFSSGQACTATTTPSLLTTFNDATLAAGEMIWMTTSAASSTGVFLQIEYTTD